MDIGVAGSTKMDGNPLRKRGDLARDLGDAAAPNYTPRGSE